MNWEEVCTDSGLNDLPYKIELNQRGQIIMSPVKVYHSIFQWRIQRSIYELLKKGEVVPECAVNTEKGTKVADVAWISDSLLKTVRKENACSVAPEICVEVMSESNTEEEMQEKRELYFEKGAKEVWICDDQGNIAFYNPKGKLKKSRMVPDFPENIDI